MKKRIIKTSIITIAIMLATYLIVWGAICLFYPVGLAKIHAELKDYKGATKYYEIDYKRKGGYDRLATLTEYSYLAKDHKKVVKYGEKLLEHEDFDFEDKNYYADVCCFIIGSKYQLNHTDTVEKTMGYCFIIEENAVTEFIDDCLNLLISKAVPNQDVQTLKEIQRQLNDYSEKFSPLDYFYSDVEEIYQTLEQLINQLS